MEIILNEAFWVALLAAGLRLATPILLGALGEIFAERAGILNIGLEGMMLVGALAAYLGAVGVGDAWFGALCGVLAGMALGLLFAFLTVTLNANQIVCGIVVNLLALGLTGFIHRVIFGVTARLPSSPSLGTWDIPFLSSIPFLGPVVFKQHAFVYLSLFLIAVSWFVLFRTTWGLNIRAVGEHPQAADTLGVNVFRVRYAAILTCGALAGLGGAFLSLAQLNVFVEGMTEGRGFIALAVVIFARWHPLGALGAAFLFGITEALQFRLQAQGSDIPFQFLAMLPYVVTVVVLVSAFARSAQPAALNKPYTKEAR